MLHRISSSDPLEILAVRNNVVIRLLLTMAENTTADLLAIYRLNSEATKDCFFIISFKNRSFHCEICELLRWMICHLATNLPIWRLYPFFLLLVGHTLD